MAFLLVSVCMVTSSFAQQPTKKIKNLKSLKPLLPDLTIVDIVVNKRCQVVVMVKNLGPGMVPDEVWTGHKPDSSDVYLYRNGKRWGGASIWKFNPGKSLQPSGGKAIYTSKLKVSGKAKITAIIDETGQVKETNEGNNKNVKNLACKVPVKIPVITGYKEKCGVKGRMLTILGRNFSSRSGKGVALGGHGIHVDLIIISWSDTRIVVRIPNDPRIEDGQRYYTGLEKADHSRWLSNISKNITICK